MPKISIVVPIYNADQYLEHCIGSVLQQTVTDWELLLINDGSTDTSADICQTFASQDSRIKYWPQPNGGATAARRAGVVHAQGEYLCFLDADDTITPDALEALLAKAISGYEVVIANTGYSEEVSTTGDEWVRRLMEARIRREVWGTLYHRSLFEHRLLDIPREIVIGEDLLMNIRCGLLAQRVLFSPKELYCYAHNDESVIATHKLTVEHETNLLKELENIMEGHAEHFEYSVFQMKYLTLQRLVAIGENPYNAPWVKKIKREKKKYTLNIRERLLLMSSSPRISRWILNGGIWVKHLLRKIR